MSKALDKYKIIDGLIGRDAVWAAIRSFEAEFTLIDIQRITLQKTATIRDYVTGLTLAGNLKQQPEGKNKKRVWCIGDFKGAERPYVDKNGKATTQHLGREQMWRTMNILKIYTYKQLSAHATLAWHPVSEGEAKAYLIALHKAGYLRIAQKPSNQKGITHYAMLPGKYTGPLPPAIQKANQVWDRNLAKVVWTETKGADE